MPIRHVEKLPFPLAMIEIQYIGWIELTAIHARTRFRCLHDLWAAATCSFHADPSRMTLVSPFTMAIRTYQIALGNLCHQPGQGRTLVAPIRHIEKLGFSFAVVQIHHVRWIVKAAVGTVTSFRRK
jgi:hypothetical protein